MSGHTPGKWHLVYEGSGEGCRSAIVEAQRLRIIVDHREDFGDPLPDARLIAAAPELLRALKDILDWMEATGITPHDPSDEMFNAGIKAVRKAEGGFNAD